MISLRPALPPNNCDLRDSELALATGTLPRKSFGTESCNDNWLDARVRLVDEPQLIYHLSARLLPVYIHQAHAGIHEIGAAARQNYSGKKSVSASICPFDCHEAQLVRGVTVCPEEIDLGVIGQD